MELQNIATKKRLALTDHGPMELSPLESTRKEMLHAGTCRSLPKELTRPSKKEISQLKSTTVSPKQSLITYSRVSPFIIQDTTEACGYMDLHAQESLPTLGKRTREPTVNFRPSGLTDTSAKKLLSTTISTLTL